MNKIEKLKKVVNGMKLKLASINGKLGKEHLPRVERMKLEYENKEILNSINNLEKYIKRLELIEKVKNYENNSRNS